MMTGAARHVDELLAQKTSDATLLKRFALTLRSPVNKLHRMMDEKVVQVTGSMLRGARAFVGLSQERLASRASISRQALALWENSSDAYPPAHYPLLVRVIDVLESEGARFRHSGIYIERGVPLSRATVLPEATVAS
jgi:DNA-binding XRE family transcriptional regulator